MGASLRLDGSNDRLFDIALSNAASGSRHFNFYRTDDPNTGRYLEPDPIGLRWTEPLPVRAGQPVTVHRPTRSGGRRPFVARQPLLLRVPESRRAFSTETLPEAPTQGMRGLATRSREVAICARVRVRIRFERAPSLRHNRDGFPALSKLLVQLRGPATLYSRPSLAGLGSSLVILVLVSQYSTIPRDASAGSLYDTFPRTSRYSCRKFAWVAHPHDSPASPYRCTPTGSTRRSSSISCNTLESTRLHAVTSVAGARSASGSRAA